MKDAKNFKEYRENKVWREIQKKLSLDVQMGTLSVLFPFSCLMHLKKK